MSISLPRSAPPLHRHHERFPPRAGYAAPVAHACRLALNRRPMASASFPIASAPYQLHLIAVYCRSTRRQPRSPSLSAPPTRSHHLVIPSHRAPLPAQCFATCRTSSSTSRSGRSSCRSRQHHRVLVESRHVIISWKSRRWPAQGSASVRRVGSAAVVKCEHRRMFASIPSFLHPPMLEPHLRQCLRPGICECPSLVLPPWMTLLHPGRMPPLLYPRSGFQSAGRTHSTTRRRTRFRRSGAHIASHRRGPYRRTAWLPN